MHRIPGRVMRMDPEQKKMYRELQKTLRKIQIVLYELDPTLVDSQHRWRRMGRQFGQGVIKGLGGAVGFTILGAIVMAILTSLAAHNIPVIGDFIARIVEIVNATAK